MSSYFFLGRNNYDAMCLHKCGRVSERRGGAILDSVTPVLEHNTCSAGSRYPDVARKGDKSFLGDASGPRHARNRKKLETKVVE